MRNWYNAINCPCRITEGFFFSRKFKRIKNCSNEILYIFKGNEKLIEEAFTSKLSVKSNPKRNLTNAISFDNKDNYYS